MLTAEVARRLRPDRWTVTVDGLVGRPTTWLLQLLPALAAATGITVLP